MVKTLLKQVRQYRKAAILCPVFAVLEVILEALIPYITAALIDQGLETSNIANVYRYGGLMLTAGFLSLAASVFCGTCAAKASTGFGANLREAMFNNIQAFSFTNIDKFSTSGLITRLTTDVTNVQNAFQMCIRIAVRAPLMLLTSLVMTILISPRMSLLFLGAMVILASAAVLIISKVSRIFSVLFKEYDALNAATQENVSAIRVVKAYVREEYENEKFRKASGKLKELGIKAERIMATISPAMTLVIYACILLISWIGAQFIVGGTLTTGELTSLFSYCIAILMSLLILAAIFVMLTMSIASAKRIAEVLDEVPSLGDPEVPVKEVKDGSIEFRNVSFAYAQGSGRATLKNVNLKIEAGETIGVIGGTGCGKSSLVYLISRLYDVNEGELLEGGVDVRDYEMETLRNQVAVVLQKNVLFSGTILENLRWGNEHATEEECIEACRQACADEFVRKFPDGYETHIEQGGTNVSGGQKQRLCIARALLKKPKILILDDSTSAVDTATDAAIRTAFASAIPGTTKLIIAQRISSVHDADRVIVMEDGRVLAFDTPEKLLETNEIYRDIYETQTRGGGDFDDPGLSVHLNKEGGED